MQALGGRRYRNLHFLHCGVNELIPGSNLWRGHVKRGTYFQVVQLWHRKTHFQCVELIVLEGSVVNVAPL